MTASGHSFVVNDEAISAFYLSIEKKSNYLTSCLFYGHADSQRSDLFLLGNVSLKFKNGAFFKMQYKQGWRKNIPGNNNYFFNNLGEKRKNLPAKEASTIDGNWLNI